MTASFSMPADVLEARNDAFAAAHDIDEYYARSSPIIRWIEASRLRVIRRLVEARPAERILEIGCGGGHVLRMFPQCERTGIDVSGAMLEKAARNLAGSHVTLLKGETSALKLPGAGFDAVICTEVLEHTVEPERILADIRRLLAPGGRVVITFPNDHLIHRLKSVLRSCHLDKLPPFGRIAWGGDEYHLHIWSYAQMRDLLRSYFNIRRERFAPHRWLPVRCCFLCTR